MIRAAVAQYGPVLGDPQRTLDRLSAACAAAAQAGAQLVVFPEAFIGGYPKGMSFGASVGIRTAEGRVMFREYASGAIEVPGPGVEFIGKLAQAHAIHLVVGVIEREGGTLYCTSLYFSAAGRLLGKHRKLVPTAAERLLWGCGDGSTLQVFATQIGRLGGLICWENYMPLARMAMYRQGVQLYCAPTVDDRDTWIPTLRHIAREGRCYVLSSCQFLTRDDYPAGWLAAATDLPTVPIRGGSCIVDPLGNVLGGPLYDGEGHVYADIDLSRLPEAQFDFDVVGHYARTDVFGFDVKVPVQAGSESPGSGQ